MLTLERAVQPEYNPVACVKAITNTLRDQRQLAESGCYKHDSVTRLAQSILVSRDPFNALNVALDETSLDLLVSLVTSDIHPIVDWCPTDNADVAHTYGIVVQADIDNVAIWDPGSDLTHQAYRPAWFVKNRVHVPQFPSEQAKVLFEGQLVVPTREFIDRWHDAEAKHWMCWVEKHWMCWVEKKS